MEVKRSRTSDFIKGVALVAMVQLVLVEYFAKPEIFTGLTGKISMFLGGAPAAPVFLTVMGYYLAVGKKSLRAMMIRGFSLIALGFLLNILRNAVVLWHVFQGLSTQNPWDLILGTDILILAGASAVVMALLIRVLKGHVLAYLALIILFLLLQYIVPPVEKTFPTSHLAPFIYGKYPHALFPFIPWFAYVLAGYAFYLFKQFFVADDFKHNHTVKVVLLVLSGLLLLLTLPFGFNVSIKPIFFFHHGILFFLFCVNFVFWWLLLARAIVNRVNNPVTQYLEYLGKNVTVFYVMFMVLAGNLLHSMQKTMDYPELVLWFLGLMFLSSLLVKLWEKAGKRKRNSIS